jgi:tripartite-type tricarboxylate transporter receptor subunit TctC
MRRVQDSATTILIALGLACAAPASTQAQPRYPAKPVRLVVAFTPGGTPDMLARLVTPRISENWKQPVIIENRPGASGTIGAAIVARAPADGYTLLAISPSFAITAALQPNLPYDPLKDFVGVAQFGFSTSMLVVAPGLGVKSVKELIALAQAQPGKLLFGSAGAGTATHINGERFRLAAGIKAQHVGFKGQPEFLIEIVAGRIHFGVVGIGLSLVLVKDGKLVPLAVVMPQRSPVLPDVPAAPEVLPGWTRNGSQAWLAPAGTPRAVLNQINKEVGRALAIPEVRQRLESYDYQVVTGTPEEVDKSIRADIEIFTKVVKDAGLRAK